MLNLDLTYVFVFILSWIINVLTLFSHPLELLYLSTRIRDFGLSRPSIKHTATALLTQFTGLSGKESWCLHFQAKKLKCSKARFFGFVADICMYICIPVKHSRYHGHRSDRRAWAWLYDGIPSQRACILQHVQCWGKASGLVVHSEYWSDVRTWESFHILTRERSHHFRIDAHAILSKWIQDIGQFDEWERGLKVGVEVSFHSIWSFVDIHVTLGCHRCFLYSYSTSWVEDRESRCFF